MKLERLLQEFATSRQEREKERRYWRGLRIPFAAVVDRAAMAVTRTGTLDAHQRRVGRAVLTEFAQALASKVAALHGARSFDELHAVVSRARVRRTGDLTIFDTALRIGYHRGLLPNHVYLHAGTRHGAHALVMSTKGRRVVPLDEFPVSLRALGAHQVEHFLCVKADDLRQGGKAPRPSERRRRC